MKDYKTIAENVLRRRDEYLEKKKRRRAVIFKVSSAAFAAGAAALIGIGIWQNSTVRNAAPSPSEDKYRIVTEVKTTAEAIAETEISTTVTTVEITTEKAVSTAAKNDTTEKAAQTSTTAQKKTVRAETATAASSENAVRTTAAPHKPVTVHTTTAWKSPTVPAAVTTAASSRSSRQTTARQTTIKNTTKTTTAKTTAARTTTIPRTASTTTVPATTTEMYTTTAIETTDDVLQTTGIMTTTSITTTTTAATHTGVYYTKTGTTGETVLTTTFTTLPGETPWDYYTVSTKYKAVYYVDSDGGEQIYHPINSEVSKDMIGDYIDSGSYTVKDYYGTVHTYTFDLYKINDFDGSYAVAAKFKKEPGYYFAVKHYYEPKDINDFFSGIGFEKYGDFDSIYDQENDCSYPAVRTVESNGIKQLIPMKDEIFGVIMDKCGNRTLKTESPSYYKYEGDQIMLIRMLLPYRLNNCVIRLFSNGDVIFYTGYYSMNYVNIGADKVNELADALRALYN